MVVLNTPEIALETFLFIKLSTGNDRSLILYKHVRPALVAQLDAPSDWRPGVAGSTPIEVGNILSWRLIMKYYLRSFFPLPLIQEGQLSVSGKRMCAILVTETG